MRAIAALDDPVGDVVAGWRLPNGLDIQKVRVPLGVLLVVYEARPNVTVDVAGLCLKSGNACLLRGSTSARHTNAVLLRCVREGLVAAGLPEDAVISLEATREELAAHRRRLRPPATSSSRAAARGSRSSCSSTPACPCSSPPAATATSTCTPMPIRPRRCRS